MQDDPQSVFERLRECDRAFLEKAVKCDLKDIVDEVRDFSEQCAQNYELLWEADLLPEAEVLRMWSFFWSIKVKEATGKLKFPHIPDVRRKSTKTRSSLLSDALCEARRIAPPRLRLLENIIRVPDSSLFYDRSIRDILEFAQRESILNIFYGPFGPKADEHILVWKFLLGSSRVLQDPAALSRTIKNEAVSSESRETDSNRMWNAFTLTYCSDVNEKYLFNEQEYWRSMPRHHLLAIDFRSGRVAFNPSYRAPSRHHEGAIEWDLIDVYGGNYCGSSPWEKNDRVTQQMLDAMDSTHNISAISRAGNRV